MMQVSISVLFLLFAGGFLSASLVSLYVYLSNREQHRNQIARYSDIINELRARCLSAARMMERWGDRMDPTGIPEDYQTEYENLVSEASRLIKY